MVVFDAVVELAPGGGDGAAGPAAGAVSALGVGADVGAGGVGVYLVGFKSADEGVVYRGVVEVYPSGTRVEDQVGFVVGGKGVDGDASVGVFEDEVDESLCGGGCGLVGVGVDVTGDDGGGGAIAGECECGGVIRVVVDAQSWLGLLFFVFGAQVAVDEGADKSAQISIGGYCLVGCGGGEEVCECGVDGFKMLWGIFKPVEFAVDDAQLVKV